MSRRPQLRFTERTDRALQLHYLWLDVGRGFGPGGALSPAAGAWHRLEDVWFVRGLLGFGVSWAYLRGDFCLDLGPTGQGELGPPGMRLMLLARLHLQLLLLGAPDVLVVPMLGAGFAI